MLVMSGPHSPSRATRNEPGGQDGAWDHSAGADRRLLAFSVFRVRRKMGMGGATGRMWTVAIIGIALGLLVLWVFQTQN